MDDYAGNQYVAN